MLGSTGKSGLNLWTKEFRKATYVSILLPKEEE
jgi:hypothetical protein